jgi:hypothetical protein
MKFGDFKFKVDIKRSGYLDNAHEANYYFLKQESSFFLLNSLSHFEVGYICKGLFVAGWWGHQPGQTAVAGGLTDHSFKMKATIWNAPLNSLSHFEVGYICKGLFPVFKACTGRKSFP